MRSVCRLRNCLYDCSQVTRTSVFYVTGHTLTSWWAANHSKKVKKIADPTPPTTVKTVRPKLPSSTLQVPGFHFCQASITVNKPFRPRHSSSTWVQNLKAKAKTKTKTRIICYHRRLLWMSFWSSSWRRRLLQRRRRWWVVKLPLSWHLTRTIITVEGGVHQHFRLPPYHPLKIPLTLASLTVMMTSRVLQLLRHSWQDHHRKVADRCKTDDFTTQKIWWK